MSKKNDLRLQREGTILKGISRKSINQIAQKKIMRKFGKEEKMKRFNVGTGFFDENKTIDAFIEEVIKVFEKYNLMILFDDESPHILINRILPKELEKIRNAGYYIYDEIESKIYDAKEAENNLG